MMKIPAGEFKAKCLKLMSDVQKYHEEIIVTKFGKAVVKVVPVNEKPVKQVFGLMKDTIAITGDIVKPIDIDWNVNG